MVEGRHVFWSGFPGLAGGANTECWHTAKLLRANGVGVTFIPTKGADLKFAPRLEEIGCKIVKVGNEELHTVPGLKDAIVIGMCNSNFIAMAHVFRDLGCKTIWINCMTFCYAGELQHYQQYNKTFDAYVFQSNWAKQKIEPVLVDFGYDPKQGHVIRGAFSIEEFPFRPRSHKTGQPFVIGRLSRAEQDKYSSNTWPIYSRVVQACARDQAVQARVMAWRKCVEEKCGKPPDWAQCLDSCVETPQEFLGSLHALIQVNGGAGENWPRSGLEAMATGVPLVVQNAWGWREMVKHGQTGYLCDNDEQLAFYAARLAYDEPTRIGLVAAARSEVENNLANPKPIWAGWERLLDGLGG